MYPKFWIHINAIQGGIFSPTPSLKIFIIDHNTIPCMFFLFLTYKALMSPIIHNSTSSTTAFVLIPAAKLNFIFPIK